MSIVWDDARHAARVLAKRRGFALAALTTLALGIGANTAIFSVVQGVLVRPLPYPDSDRLVRISEEHPGANSPLQRSVLSNLTFNAWRPTRTTLEDFGAYSEREYSLRSSTGTQRIDGADVSPSIFSILRATPAAGRLLHASDEAEGAEDVVVLAHAFWLERFGGDVSAIGQTLTLDDVVHTIVGVARPGFYFPNRDGKVWTVRRVSTATGSTQIINVLGRLAQTSTPAAAAAEGTSAARSVPRPFVTEVLFGKGGPVEVRVLSLADQMTASIRPALVVLAIGVGFVLLIGCANVANLCLAHGVARRRELAMRVALGASRGRIVRHLLTESMLLSMAGGAAGLALGWALIRALPTLAPVDFPRLDDIRIDAGVVLFALIVSVLAGVLTGILPAIRGARLSLAPVLNEGSRSSSGARTARVRAALIVAESALAVMLLVGASLLVRSFVALVHVDAGYDAGNVLSARIYLPGAQRSAADNQTFVERLLPRVRTLPGVVAAGAGNMSPFGQNTTVAGFELPGMDGSSITARATMYIVTPGYAEALRLRLRAGRLLDERDFGASIQPIIVNEQFARTYFTDGRPVVGRQFPSTTMSRDPAAKKLPGAEIIGVVADVLKDNLDGQPQNEVYLLPTNGNLIRREVHLVVRTAGDPSAIIGALRPLVAEVDPSAALGSMGSLESRVSTSVGQPRFATTVLGAVALLGLLLSAIGLYGVLSYNVSERRREMGVRTALGASRQQILAMVIRQGLGVTLLGLAIGLIGAAMLSELLRSVLFGIQPRDIVAFTATPVVLLMVALLACVIPAWRAASVDPAEALRAE